MASVGHVMDLPKETLGIDIDTFTPKYEIYPDKKKIIAGLKTVLKNNPNINVYIASDGDREGEFIGYSLVQLLNLNSYHRIIFHEITKEAITKAISEKTDHLNNNLICAQMCRRMIDRCIGYPVSKELSSKIKGAYAAGRVQSTIVKMIYDKCKERDDFIANIQNNKSTITSNMTCTAIFLIEGHAINCNMYCHNWQVKCNERIMMHTLNVFKEIKPNPHIENINERNTLTWPNNPFITSTLQQDAYYKYKYSPDKTMIIVQHLYERGHITYMRTDSPNLSNDILYQTKNYIVNTYGEHYHNYKQYKAKGNAQEAHEAIRPTHINVTNIEGASDEENNIYDLIWKRTVASQMIPCITKNTDITIKYAAEIVFSEVSTHLPHFVGTISVVTEPGFKILYDIERNDEDVSNEELNENVTLNIKLDSKVSFKEMTAKGQIPAIPTLYNQPSIIKTLEKYGIGRPSTFATLLKKIIEYKYVTISFIKGFEITVSEFKLSKNYITNKVRKSIIGGEKQKYIITDLGKEATLYLMQHYPSLMNYKFTSDMELKLDQIAEGKLHYINVIREFNQVTNIKLNSKKVI
jgi:DNA topoisomerase-1